MNEKRLTCQTISKPAGGKPKGLQHGVSKVKMKSPQTTEVGVEGLGKKIKLISGTQVEK